MRLLKSQLTDHIDTKATTSVPSPIMNMRDFLKINVEAEKQEESTEFEAKLKSRREKLMKNVIHQMAVKFWSKHWDRWDIPHLYQYVDPENSNGILDKYIDELK